jgi:hypothetical protein
VYVYTSREKGRFGKRTGVREHTHKSNPAKTLVSVRVHTDTYAYKSYLVHFFIRVNKQNFKWLNNNWHRGDTCPLTLRIVTPNIISNWGWGILFSAVLAMSETRNFFVPREIFMDHESNATFAPRTNEISYGRWTTTDYGMRIKDS